MIAIALSESSLVFKNEQFLRDLIMGIKFIKSFIYPPIGKDPPLTMCMCHIDSTDEPSKLTSGGYHCPQCYSKYCDLPVECASCGLTLASAPHLARSYHHLFPVPHFQEMPFENQASICYGCQKPFADSTDKTVYQCGTCQQVFCIDCDIFIHETMHSCVGCTTIPASVQALHARKPVAPPIP